jgi:hypothetical protein
MLGLADTVLLNCFNKLMHLDLKAHPEKKDKCIVGHVSTRRKGNKRSEIPSRSTCTELVNLKDRVSKKNRKWNKSCTYNIVFILCGLQFFWYNCIFAQSFLFSNKIYVACTFCLSNLSYTVFYFYFNTWMYMPMYILYKHDSYHIFWFYLVFFWFYYSRGFTWTQTCSPYPRRINGR